MVLDELMRTIHVSVSIFGQRNLPSTARTVGQGKSEGRGKTEKVGVLVFCVGEVGGDMWPGESEGREESQGRGWDKHVLSSACLRAGAEGSWVRVDGSVRGAAEGRCRPLQRRQLFF